MLSVTVTTRSTRIGLLPIGPKLLGGPADYSEKYGDETSVVRIDRGNGIHEEMDQRAIACFDQAMDNVGIAHDGPLRGVLHDYFAWATTTTMARYHSSANDVPDGMDVPKWSWDGPVTAETDAIRKAYAALNQNDIPGFAQILDPQIGRIEPDDFPGGGTYHGIEAVKAHISQGRSTWAEGSCEPERFVVAGDKTVVFLHVRARLNGHTEWIDVRIADVFTFRNGKAIQLRTFADEQQALEFAGVS